MLDLSGMDFSNLGNDQQFKAWFSAALGAAAQWVYCEEAIDEAAHLSGDVKKALRTLCGLIEAWSIALDDGVRARMGRKMMAFMKEVTAEGWNGGRDPGAEDLMAALSSHLALDPEILKTVKESVRAVLGR